MTKTARGNRAAFGEDVGFYMGNRQEAARRSRDVTSPLPMRIREAALSRVASTGHAEFGDGELSDMVGRYVVASTGELRRYDRTQIQRAINQLIGWGYLDAGSSKTRNRCLMVPTYAEHYALGRGKRCGHHGQLD